VFINRFHRKHVKKNHRCLNDEKQRIINEIIFKRKKIEPIEQVDIKEKKSENRNGCKQQICEI
jgi:hypothetical protein